MAEDAGPSPAGDPATGGGDSKRDAAPVAEKKSRPGFLSRLRGWFGGSGDDFEKKLKHLSKEEAAVHARIKRRAQSSRKTARNVIVLSIVVEVVAVGYAIMTTRSLYLDWQMRAVRVLPMFLLPALSSVIYTALVRITRMLDRKDQKTLDRLRGERQAKIDELKERTNYYATQQLIQRYDFDPASKAAAATVLASKLASDSGLKVYVGDESNINASSGKSSDVEMVQSNGLRNRRPSHQRNRSTGSATMDQFVDQPSDEFGDNSQEAAAQNERVVEHYKGTGGNEGGWMARIAALLVGEDPTQCYALICGNCHMHNGLARKEDFPYITYYCPHCNALNGSHRAEDTDSASNSGIATPIPSTPGDGNNASHNATIGNLPTVEELLPEEKDEKELLPEENDEKEAAAQAS